MRSPPSTQVRGLDHLRALAIAMVFFFVLSGYLIASQLLAPLAEDLPLQLREFFVKRALRILPPYLFVLVIYFLLPIFREREALPPLWRFLSFTQNFGLDLRINGTFSHAWSLCIEEQFYLALPLVVFFGARFKRLRPLSLMLPLLVILGLGLREFAWQHDVAPVLGQNNEVVAWYRSIYYPTYQRLDGLIVGVSLAAAMAFSSRLRFWIQTRSIVLLIAATVVIASAWWIFWTRIRVPHPFGVFQSSPWAMDS